MTDVYERCPILTGSTLTLRLVTMDDAEDLLQVYGDERSVPFFQQ